MLPGKLDGRIIKIPGEYSKQLWRLTGTDPDRNTLPVTKANDKLKVSTHVNWFEELKKRVPVD